MRRNLVLVAVLIAILAAAGPAPLHAITCEPKESTTPPRVKAVVTTPGLYNRVQMSSEESVSLTPLLQGESLSQDTKLQPLKIGVHRALPAGSAAKWRIISQTSAQLVVRTVIHSPEAVMIRPHFSSFPGDEKAEIYVYGDDPSTAEGPISRPDYIETTDFWGPPIRTQNYYIEIVFTPPPAEYKSSLPVIDKISHVFKDIFTSSLTASSLSADSSCMNDFTCYAASSALYTLEGKGVAVLAAELKDTTGFCTGALVNDTAGSETPWFLTADHCKVTKSVAPTTYFYFNFQTSTCNGTPPDLQQVTPRVDGATLMVSKKNTDFTLLRLAGTTPPGYHPVRLEYQPYQPRSLRARDSSSGGGIQAYQLRTDFRGEPDL